MNLIPSEPIPVSDQEVSSPASDDIATALGRVPSGCCILTAKHENQSTGMLASWVQQAAFEPPSISVAVKKDRPIETLIDASGLFALNVIGENPGAMFKHFGKGFKPGEPAFDGVACRETEAGFVLDACIAHIECKVMGKHPAGDHWLYIGQVVNAGGDPDAKPYVHLRKNGLNY